MRISVKYLISGLLFGRGAGLLYPVAVQAERTFAITLTESSNDVRSARVAVTQNYALTYVPSAPDCFYKVYINGDH